MVRVPNIDVARAVVPGDGWWDRPERRRVIRPALGRLPRRLAAWVGGMVGARVYRVRYPQPRRVG